MGSRGIEIVEDEPLAGVPEDVAALYAWAGVKGARYRDFSGSRREYRAQMRYRAALLLRDRELAAENTDAAARAGAVALLEEREIAEARASAEQQAKDYLDSAELGRRVNQAVGARGVGVGEAIPKDAASSMRQGVGESGGSGEAERLSLRAPSFGAYGSAEGMEEPWEAVYLASELTREVGQLRLPWIEEPGIEESGVGLGEGRLRAPSKQTAEAPAWLRGGPAVATEEPDGAGRSEP